MDTQLVRDYIFYAELVAAITGTYFFYKYKQTPYKYFLFYLWLVVLVEFTGGYIRDNKILVYIDSEGQVYNKWLYNSYRFLAFNILFYIYYKVLKNSLYKKIIRIFAISYCTIFVINWSFFQNFIKESSELPKIIGSLSLIISVIFYLIELLKSEKILIFHRMVSFWISIGLLIFYAGNIPFSLKWNNYMLISGIHNLFLIVYILAILMYLIFTFGFIWSKKE